MPGFGLTPASTATGYTVTARVDHLRRVLDAFALDRPLVVGHSMGGVLVTARSRLERGVSRSRLRRRGLVRR